MKTYKIFWFNRNKQVSNTEEIKANSKKELSESLKNRGYKKSEYIIKRINLKG